jgi:hypothetical protein
VAAGIGHSYEVGHSLPGQDFTLARGSWERVVMPRLAIGVEGIPWLRLKTEDGDPDQEDDRAFGFSFIGRWLLLASPSARLGLDGGAGMLRFEDAVPAGGQELNYTLQLGGFLELPVTAGLGLIAGCRVHHISNRNEGEVNPGINAVHPYLELRLWRTPSRPLSLPDDGDGGTIVAGAPPPQPPAVRPPAPAPVAKQRPRVQPPVREEVVRAPRSDGPILGLDATGRRR